MSGLIHIYCGDGKGKTTAATGLAARAAGAEKKVVFVQFLKKGDSSEIRSLKKLDQIEVCSLSTHLGFFKTLNDEEREETRQNHTLLFEEIILRSQSDADVLILDEVITACNYQMIQESELIDFLQKKPEHLEVILTGRKPSDELLDMADYVTEMKKIKHPYDKGIIARLGIEF